MYEVELFVDDEGKCPFKDWLDKLKDQRAKAKLLARLRRASDGNFGDWKHLADTDGVFEMREHSGEGFRIYYAIIGKKLVVILAGSNKRDQQKTIEKAKQYLLQQRKRKKS